MKNLILNNTRTIFLIKKKLPNNFNLKNWYNNKYCNKIIDNSWHNKNLRKIIMKEYGNTDIKDRLVISKIKGDRIQRTATLSFTHPLSEFKLISDIDLFNLL